MTTGYIPRKKAKAPKFTIPSGGEIIQNIENLIVDIKKNLPEVENLNANSFVEHPLFGHLNLKQTIKFLSIHTHHHLKIIKRCFMEILTFYKLKNINVVIDL